MTPLSLSNRLSGLMTCPSIIPQPLTLWVILLFKREDKSSNTVTQHHSQFCLIPSISLHYISSQWTVRAILHHFLQALRKTQATHLQSLLPFQHVIKRGEGNPSAADTRSPQSSCWTRITPSLWLLVHLISCSVRQILLGSFYSPLSRDTTYLAPNLLPSAYSSSERLLYLRIVTHDEQTTEEWKNGFSTGFLAF